jgi:hypothetical protein
MHSFSTPTIYEHKDFSKPITFQEKHIQSSFLDNTLVILNSHFYFIDWGGRIFNSFPSFILFTEEDFQDME